MRYSVSLLLAILMMLIVLGCSSQNSNPVVTPSGNPDNSENLFERDLSTGNQTNQPYWSDTIFFEGEYWLGRRNENGSVSRAFGKGVKLNMSDEEIIDSHPEIFKVPSSTLVKVEEYTQDRIRYVFYRQQINGIEVKDSRVELRYARNGNLMLIGADVFPELTMDTNTSISESDAAGIATRDCGNQAKVQGLVIEKRENSEFHLVWWVITPETKYHIDAHSGTILEWQPTVLDNHEWETTASMYEYTPSTPVMTFPYPNQLNQVDIPDQGIIDFYADRSGYVNIQVENESLAVNSFMHSPWVNLIPCDGVYPQGQIAWESANDQGNTILFDDTNSHMGERMVGYWANISHDYIKDIDPTYTGMDFPLDSRADCCCTCNAFANIEEYYMISMYSASGGCVATSEVADVIVHEYGHIYVQTQYTLGTPSYSIHEAFADYLANTVTNYPEIGRDITGPGTMFRSSVNSVMWDNNECWGESHCEGNILAGALWEIRSQLGADYVDYLQHQARFAQTNSFEGFIVDFYMIDDDDDNVLNGTPNMDVFEAAFWDNHHLPIPQSPDIPTSGVTIDIVPSQFPLEMDRTKINNNLWYTLKIKNLDNEVKTFDAWTMVETPWATKYGPMIPASTKIRGPFVLTLQPYGEFSIPIRHAIPPGLPVGTYRYHARIGDFVDNDNDILLDDGWIDFELY
jgi:hypothetical protein